jgi:diguanylate cyclase (GGDEF)-like protein
MSVRQTTSEDLLGSEINPWTLAFEPRTEAEFMTGYLRRSLGQIRLAIVVAVLFYAAATVLDASAAPEAAKTLRLIRFAGFLPLSAVVFALTYADLFRKVWQWVLSIWAFLGGVGVVAMVGLAGGETRNSYYAGLILAFIILYAWSRIRFVWATLTGWLIVAAYEIVMLGILHMPMSSLLSQNFFFVAANILGMLACYSIERSARMDFIMARLLREEQEKVRTAGRRLAARDQEAKDASEYDELTKLPGRAMFDKDLKSKWYLMARESRPLSLLLCDLDHFRLFNDTYGKAAGDECLAKVAKALGVAARRPGDFAARFDGEVFAVALLGTPIEGAVRVAENICLAVQNLRIPQARPDGETVVTVSVGVAAMFPSLDHRPEEIIGKAGDALILAKNQGRNRVAVVKCPEGKG